MEIPKIIITSERGEQMASTEVVDHAAAQEDVDATEQELLMWSAISLCLILQQA